MLAIRAYIVELLFVETQADDNDDIHVPYLYSAYHNMSLCAVGKSKKER